MNNSLARSRLPLRAPAGPSGLNFPPHLRFTRFAMMACWQAEAPEGLTSLARRGDGIPAIVWSWRIGTVPGESAGESENLSVACRRTVKMARAEAVLLVSDGPRSPRRLARLATLPDATAPHPRLHPSSW